MQEDDIEEMETDRQTDIEILLLCTAVFTGHPVPIYIISIPDTRQHVSCQPTLGKNFSNDFLFTSYK